MAMLNKDSAEWSNYKNFVPKEFLCECGCGGCDMDSTLIDILQSIRDKYGKSVTVTSGYRCQTYNDSLKGSVKTSDHLKGKAADIYIKGITNSVAGRAMVIGYASSFPNFKYAYCNGWYYSATKGWKTYSASNMGSAVHISVN